MKYSVKTVIGESYSNEHLTEQDSEVIAFSSDSFETNNPDLKSFVESQQPLLEIYKIPAENLKELEKTGETVFTYITKHTLSITKSGA